MITSSFADNNNNGVVDAADFVSWQNNLGLAGTTELTNLTSVQFGVGPVSGVPEPIYNAASDRQVTLTSDHADALIQVATSATGLESSAADTPEPPLTALLLAAIAWLTSRRSVVRPLHRC